MHAVQVIKFNIKKSPSTDRIRYDREYGDDNRQVGNDSALENGDIAPIIIDSPGDIAVPIIIDSPNEVKLKVAEMAGISGLNIQGSAMPEFPMYWWERFMTGGYRFSSRYCKNIGVQPGQAPHLSNLHSRPQAAGPIVTTDAPPHSQLNPINATEKVAIESDKVASSASSDPAAGNATKEHTIDLPGLPGSYSNTNNVSISVLDVNNSSTPASLAAPNISDCNLNNVNIDSIHNYKPHARVQLISNEANIRWRLCMQKI